MIITLTDTSAFVVTARNESNSEFYIRSKKDFENEMRNGRTVVSVMTEGVKKESTIIDMIGDGVKFYTYNYSNKEFTEIDVVEDHIHSTANDTEEDNIQSLPLL